LWAVESRDHPSNEVFCGPVAVAALIGANVDDVICMIQRHRNDYSTVKVTSAEELQRVFEAYNYRLERDSDLLFASANRCPTLATWERERNDWEFEQGWLITVTGHWVAARGWWLCDTYTRGVPVRIKYAPHRRKRVRRTYRITDDRAFRP
jgi:hypothetical protein